MLEIFLLLLLGGACVVLSVYITLRIFIEHDERTKTKNLPSLPQSTSTKTTADK